MQHIYGMSTERLDAMLQAQDEQLDILETRIADVGERIGKIGERIGKLEVFRNQLKGDQAQLSSEVDEIKECVNTMTPSTNSVTPSSTSKKSEEHSKYSSIENVGEVIKKVYEEIVGADAQWIVLEKIHGSNVGIGKYGIQSRNKMLTREDKFFSIQRIWDELLGKFGKLSPEEQESCVIYGELCGGNYEHPDVPKQKGVEKVQGGMNYGPGLYFFAFDVKRDGRYLPYAEAVEIFKRCGFDYCGILKEGTLAECTAFDVETFESTIPAYLGLPPPTQNRCAEGVVIKPRDGDYRTKMGSRVILKKKMEKFDEVVMKRRKPGSKPVKEEDPYWTTLQAYVTRARLESILSKDGFPEITKQKMGYWSAAMCKDIEESYCREQNAVGNTENGLCKLITESSKFAKGDNNEKRLEALRKQVRGASSKVILQYMRDQKALENA